MFLFLFLYIGKEYDHVNWDCLFFMVKIVGFGEKWRKWVWYFGFVFRLFGFKLWFMVTQLASFILW